MDEDIPVLGPSDNPIDDLGKFFGHGPVRKFKKPFQIIYAKPALPAMCTHAVWTWTDLMYAHEKFQSGEWTEFSRLPFVMQVFSVLFGRLGMIEEEEESC